MRQNASSLRENLQRIDHRGYPAYKDLRGSWKFERYTLSIDHVQGDPFAAPSRLHVEIPGMEAGFPESYIREPHRRIALEDLLTRHFSAELSRFSMKVRGSGKSGLLSCSRPQQEILQRTACEIRPDDGNVLVRFDVGFPANGRTIQARGLEKIFFDILPGCIERSLFCRSLNDSELRQTIDLADDQQFIRNYLKEHDLAAFVADSSILPRSSGISSLPMAGARPFRSPESLRVEICLPHRGMITGMGIRRGVTLIVGGGYHGKSTLIKALESGVYDHIRGDGREYVITDDTAVKIRAEEGRNIVGDDISLFIHDLPNGSSTAFFSTQDASGSTSQAANVIEAMEAGSSLFLIDEDTCAANFMVRDELMQRVIAKDNEPITPYISRIRGLYRDFGISTILVAGSSGSFFPAADTVIQMDRYEPSDITDFAHREAKSYYAAVSRPEKKNPDSTRADDLPLREPDFCRIPVSDRIFRDPDARIRRKILGKDGFSIERSTVDLHSVEQVTDPEQTAALAQILQYAEQKLFDGRRTLRECLDCIEEVLGKDGLSAICGKPAVDAAMPRRQEIAAAINRYRGLKISRSK